MIIFLLVLVTITIELSYNFVFAQRSSILQEIHKTQNRLNFQKLSQKIANKLVFDLTMPLYFITSPVFTMRAPQTRQKLIKHISSVVPISLFSELLSPIFSSTDVRSPIPIPFKIYLQLSEKILKIDQKIRSSLFFYWKEIIKKALQRTQVLCFQQLQ